MENKSNHSANVPNTTSASQQNVNMSQSSNDNIATIPVDNSFSATAAIGTIPVQSIDILKESKEKADITISSEDKVATVPNVKPSNIPILSSIINQRQNMVASVEQVEIPPPTPTIVAQSIDSGFLNDTTADKLPNVQTVYPQQTVQQQMSSAAQFKAELTVKNSTPATVDGSNNIDEAPQELAFHRTTSSAPNNSYSSSGNNHPSSTFDGFAGKMNKLRDQMSSIFPAGIMGCRDKVAETNGSSVDVNSTESSSNSRRFMDAKEASLDCVGHIDSTPRKRPSSCKPSTGRNPLTGFGLDDADDLKRGFGRRKDGNPVLGVGYDAESSEDAVKPSGRVPPGGHSTKLW